MKHFSKSITRHYIGVLIAGAVVFLLSLYGMSLTKINYDILSYLPEDLDSVKGENILDSDFHTAGSALMMVDITDMQSVQKLKDEIGDIKGVKEVLWIDSVTDTQVPLDYLSDEVKEQFIKGNATLLQIQFEKPASSESTFVAIKDIRTLMDGKSRLGGMGALLSDLRKLMDTEKIIYILIAVALIFILLSIALDSFAVSILFLISIGAAICYNMGTNFVRGDISYITSAIAAVLQMGVTMDFSIFLYHRYEQERKLLGDKFESMARAMSSTSVAIIASSLATASGFLALVPMKIKIGEDIGIVLAKGVILGVITALTVLPAMLLLFDDFIQKTRHKPILPSFKRTSDFVVKNYVLLFIVFLVLFVPAYYGKTNAKIFYNIMDAMPSDMQSMVSTNAIKDKFGISEVIYLITDKSESRSKEDDFQNALKSISNVKSTQCIESLADSEIPDSFLPDKLKDQFQEGKYRYMMINLSTKAAEDSTNQAIASIEKKAEHYYGKNYYLSGEAVLTRDLISLTDKDIKTVDIISIAAVFIILMLFLQSVSLPIILVAVIELAIFFNLGIPYYTGTQIPFIASMTVGAIQLGSSINYSILMVTRYREELRSHDKIQAIKNAVTGTGPSIITSALTLAATTIGVGLASKIKMIGQFATMIGRGTLISFVMVLLILPAVLLVFDPVIGYTTLGWRKLGSKANLTVKGEESV